MTCAMIKGRGFFFFLVLSPRDSFTFHDFARRALLAAVLSNGAGHQSVVVPVERCAPHQSSSAAGSKSYPNLISEQKCKEKR